MVNFFTQNHLTQGKLIILFCWNIAAAVGFLKSIQGNHCFYLYIVRSLRLLFKRFSFENKIWYVSERQESIYSFLNLVYMVWFSPVYSTVTLALHFLSSNPEQSSMVLFSFSCFYT